MKNNYTTPELKVFGDVTEITQGGRRRRRQGYSGNTWRPRRRSSSGWRKRSSSGWW